MISARRAEESSGGAGKSRSWEMSMELLTAENVSNLTGLSNQTLAQWRSQKRNIPYLKIGRLIRYSQRDIQVYLESAGFLSQENGKPVSSYAPVAQRTEQGVPNPCAAGSSPARRIFDDYRKDIPLAPKRLTRKEMVQKDKIQAALSGIYEWSSENRYLLISLFGVFVLTILGSNVWQGYQGRSSHQLQIRFSETLDLYHAPVAEAEEEITEETAEAETTAEVTTETETAAQQTGSKEGDLTSSQNRFQSHQEQLEEALAGFTAIADDYPGKQLGLLARYYTALIRQELGQTEEAEQDLNFVIENSIQAEILNLARNQLAAIAQSKNDRQRATALLEQILLDESSAFPKANVLLQLAQNHEAAGNVQEALRFYRRLTTEFPTSVYSQEARSHIDQLETISNQG